MVLADHPYNAPSSIRIFHHRLGETGVTFFAAPPLLRALIHTPADRVRKSFGTLRSIDKERDRSIASAGVKTELLDYQFALTAVDITTGEELWVKTEYIRKVEKTGIFGR